MNEMLHTTFLQKIARSNNTILITGATGTGKSYLAKRIHECSARRERKYVAINLATLNENLIESELFGHERGAFSGADQKRQGKLEAANGGTVFLDEIGELPVRLQVKLLDALNHKVITPVGGNREIQLDIRIIAATNKNLAQMVQEGNFREDLYYRINTFEIELKSLSGQNAVIEGHARQFAEQCAQEQGKPTPNLSAAYIEALLSYNWPGNIRELKNALDYGVAICSTPELDRQCIPLYIQKKLQHSTPHAPSLSPISFSKLPVDYYESKAIFEKSYLLEMLSRFNGRINHTARATKISKVTLIDKIRRYEIDVNAIKFRNYIHTQNYLERA
jgi:DNA-binding NtrC family response regulator